MYFEARRVHVVGCVLLLLTVAIIGSAQAPSRGVPQPPVLAPQQSGFPDSTHMPEVIFGNDFGFRMETTQNGIAVGKLVVRVNGRWIDAQLGGAGVVPAGAR